MRAVTQIVKKATLYESGNLISHIEDGFLVYIGFCDEDTKESIIKPLTKLCGLRVFHDSNGKLNLSLKDIGGQMLLVSNFTLYADCSRGYRPSFVKSAKFEPAKELYDFAIKYIGEQGIDVKPCVFGGDMQIDSLADGPINIIIDSEDL